MAFHSQVHSRVSLICLLTLLSTPSFSIFWLERGALLWLHFCWEWSHQGPIAADESAMGIPTLLLDLGLVSASAKETLTSSLLSHPSRRSATTPGHGVCRECMAIHVWRQQSIFGQSPSLGREAHDLFWALPPALLSHTGLQWENKWVVVPLLCKFHLPKKNWP